MLVKTCDNPPEICGGCIWLDYVITGPEPENTLWICYLNLDMPVKSNICRKREPVR